MKEVVFIRQNIEKIKSLNPSWNYNLYDDSDIESFIQREYGEGMLSFYLGIALILISVLLQTWRVWDKSHKKVICE